MKSFEAYTYLDGGTDGPKPEEEWTEYDHLVGPAWRAAKAALEAPEPDNVRDARIATWSAVAALDRAERAAGPLRAAIRTLELFADYLDNGVDVRVVAASMREIAAQIAAQSPPEALVWPAGDAPAEGTAA